MTRRFIALGSPSDFLTESEPKHLFLAIKGGKSKRAIKTVIFSIKDWDPAEHRRGYKGMFIEMPDEQKKPLNKAQKGDIIVTKGGVAGRITGKSEDTTEVRLINKDNGEFENTALQLPNDTEIGVWQEVPHIGEKYPPSQIEPGTYIQLKDGKRGVMLDQPSRGDDGAGFMPPMYMVGEVDDDGEIIGSHMITESNEYTITTPKVGDISIRAVERVEELRYADKTQATLYREHFRFMMDSTGDGGPGERRNFMNAIPYPTDEEEKARAEAFLNDVDELLDSVIVDYAAGTRGALDILAERHDLADFENAIFNLRRAINDEFAQTKDVDNIAYLPPDLDDITEMARLHGGREVGQFLPPAGEFIRGESDLVRPRFTVVHGITGDEDRIEEIIKTGAVLSITERIRHGIEQRLTETHQTSPKGDVRSGIDGSIFSRHGVTSYGKIKLLFKDDVYLRRDLIVSSKDYGGSESRYFAYQQYHNILRDSVGNPMSPLYKTLTGPERTDHITRVGYDTTAELNPQWEVPIEDWRAIVIVGDGQNRQDLADDIRSRLEEMVKDGLIKSAPAVIVVDEYHEVENIVRY